MIKATEKNIQALLINHFMWTAGHLAALPNATNGAYPKIIDWEADLITINKSNHMIEYEIKLNKADYKKDGKKISKLYYLQLAYDTFKKNKNFRPSIAMPNYFYYVTHEFEIEPPVWAGWIFIKSWDYGEVYRFDMEIKKRAPKLHAETISDVQIAHLLKLLSYRFAVVCQKVYPYRIKKQPPEELC